MKTVQLKKEGMEKKKQTITSFSLTGFLHKVNISNGNLLCKSIYIFTWKANNLILSGYKGLWLIKIQDEPMHSEVRTNEFSGPYSKMYMAKI